MAWLLMRATPFFLPRQSGDFGAPFFQLFSPGGYLKIPEIGYLRKPPGRLIWLLSRHGTQPF